MAYLTNSYDVSDDATKRFTTSTTNTASNSSIATMSFWLKRRSALYRQEAMNSSVGSTNDGYLNIRSDDSILVDQRSSSFYIGIAMRKNIAWSQLFQ